MTFEGWCVIYIGVVLAVWFALGVYLGHWDW